MLTKSNGTFKQHKKTPTAPQKRFQRLYTYPQHLIQPLLNLYITILKELPRGKLLILLFLILPWNLGKNLELEVSYMGSSLIPYLVPTLYLQDILILLIVVVCLLDEILGRNTKGMGNHSIRVARSVPQPSLQVFTKLAFLFILSCLFSVFFSNRLLPSIYLFCRVFLYLLFLMTSWDLFKRKTIRQIFYISLAFNLIFLSLLSFGQFQNQASVFKNYLFFGEQPYSPYTPYIAKESYGGVVKIPPHGTFVHTNILAGYLVISLTLLVGYFVRLGRQSSILRVGSLFIFLIVVYVLSLTKSATAWVALVFGVIFLIGYYFILRLFLHNRSSACPAGISNGWCGVHAKLYQALVLLIGVGVVALGLVFPLLKTPALKISPTDSTLFALSVDRRASLLTASYQMFLEKPLFGWGLNSFTYSSQTYYTDPVLTRFYQPVHNIFALILVETGIFGLMFFLALVFYTLYQSSRHETPIYSIVLLQVIFLASFDHYFFTIHQTLLLFILTLLLSLTYTKDSNCL